jgi:hypothetical protein
MAGSSAVFLIAPDAKGMERALVQDPAWHEIEACPVARRGQPAGHISAMSLEKKSGNLLCLNANFSRLTDSNGLPAVKADRVRILISSKPGETRVLGEVKLQADGSFMAEVPSDRPLGFETVDAGGRVLRRLPPSIWVRPGENHSCLGCHEPHNRSPRNERPLAVAYPPTVLTLGASNAVACIP